MCQCPLKEDFMPALYGSPLQVQRRAIQERFLWSEGYMDPGKDKGNPALIPPNRTEG
jgi:hypothetical protein